ncbi:3' terminal RNA ribose 2'-O-methyltransferase Hen1 [Kineococcus sp. R86509]|uniref:3' terminal RNA ribose 2'-O-methyltransferase Hen1 n=1 Tax=Kineococcus sp. R86509 TaxID=3093851 RepID=UPI0036D2D4F6
MILTLTAQRPAPDVPAGDLGFLLHKHPDRVLTAEQGAVTTHVFYPENTPEQTTLAVLLEVDPVGLVRSARGDTQSVLGQYVNDRPYAASSMLAVALGRTFSTALAARCTSRPELVDLRWPLQVRLPAVPARHGGADLVRRLFEPLGWSVTTRDLPLDETVPTWGTSRYVDLELAGRARIADVLAQLYVLLPVLDDAKHYWVGEEEIDKLVRRGGDWLAAHPERDLITARYLAHRRHLVVDALDRLVDVDGTASPVEEPDNAEVRVPLKEHRRAAILAVLRESGAARVADLGCGQGQLVAALAADAQYTSILGTDVSVRALQQAARRLHLDRMPDPDRVRLFQSALTYRDERLNGLDAAVLSEVVEHVDPPRLPALERVVFGEAAPTTVIVTTPNAEYNVNYPDLFENGFRHADHRFEWTRAEFAQWAGGVCARFGYSVATLGVGDEDPAVGTPTQLAVFSKGVAA